jgi:hypothetical protein
MAEIKIYNSLKSRLETIDFEFTDQNTTWFDDCLNDDDIYMITDAFGGLLIKDYGYSYPIWIDGKSRADIGHRKHNALRLIDLYVSP